MAAPTDGPIGMSSGRATPVGLDRIDGEQPDRESLLALLRTYAESFTGVHTRLDRHDQRLDEIQKHLEMAATRDPARVRVLALVAFFVFLFAILAVLAAVVLMAWYRVSP